MLEKVLVELAKRAPNAGDSDYEEIEGVRADLCRLSRLCFCAVSVVLCRSCRQCGSVPSGAACAYKL